MSSKKKFIVNETISVCKTFGCKDGKNGPASSERADQKYPNIEPSEKLLVLQTFGSTKALVKREGRDGEADETITLHVNHINADSPYYTNKGMKKEKKSVAEAAETAEKAADALREAQEIADRAATDAARDEAAALFDEAELETATA